VWEVWNSVFDLLHRFDKPRLGGVGSRRDCYCCNMLQEPLSILSFCTNYPEQALTWTRSYFLLIYLCQFYRWNSKSFCKFVTESSFFIFGVSAYSLLLPRCTFIRRLFQPRCFSSDFYHPLFRNGASKMLGWQCNHYTLIYSNV
jgi:hypothetical protein